MDIKNYLEGTKDLTGTDLTQAAVKGAGTLLLLKGLTHRGIIGTAMAAGGLALLFPEQAAQLVNSMLGSKRTHAPQSPPADAPSFKDEHVTEPTQMPEDEVDAAMMASFPASDPPSSYRSA